MKWSELKKRIEGTFADSIKGKIEVWNTRYRKAPDAPVEAWITYNKKKVISMADYSFDNEYWKESSRIRKERKCEDYRDPQQEPDYRKAGHEAEEVLRNRSVFGPHTFNGLLFDYLSLSIDSIMQSENPIIRAFGMFDARCGKRRLKSIDISREHQLVRSFYNIRCKEEGIEGDK